MLPDDSQAYQFAVMLEHGLPASRAILYFVESEDPGEIAQLARKWASSRKVARAASELLGKDWAEMSDDEKMKSSIGFHYRQLATLLRSAHYAEADAGLKAKLDSARTAIEAKMAGVAGKGDQLSLFFEDLRSGKVKVVQTPKLVQSQSPWPV